MADFRDRVAIITGATGALGRVVALDLLRSGATVAVPYLEEEGWTSLRAYAGQDPGRLAGSPVDLKSSDGVNRFVASVVDRHGRLDFLVCVAGGFAAGRSFETDDAAWEHMLDLNLKSVVRMIRPVVPVMMRQNFGRIVTVSSGAILMGGGAGIAAYAVSKGAVAQLTEILSQELEKYDIRAHCVMPGTMDTEANRKSMPKADFSKWVKTEDVAQVIHFLLGDQSRAVRSVAVPVLG
ncbi:MAG: SDR family NAD(P)-dependent oxidoreductase [Acidobacteria bacterium]|nr:SDR family NAD(P)-dependent oxidoreductase [Acidobacteriota bacterium]